MEEDIQKSMEHITKVYEALKEITPENLRHNYCGLCHGDMRKSTGSCSALQSQNPFETTYHMQCAALLRAYENHFALRRLRDRASPFHKRWMEKEVDKAYRHFVKQYILLVLEHDLYKLDGVGYAVYQICNPLDREAKAEEGTAYKEIVAELEEMYTKNGWGSPRKTVV